MAKYTTNYHFGDTWAAGSFTYNDPRDLVDTIISSFDIPCWPELLALGPQESLTGYWLPLYHKWLENSGKGIDFYQQLNERPGIKLMRDVFSGRPLPILKGQMIGPATLKWSLISNKLPLGSDELLVQFVGEAMIAQIQALSRFASNVVITLDEPSAYFVPEAKDLWQKVFLQIDKYRPYGVALHCCGSLKVEWLELPWQVVHFDAAEILEGFEEKPHDWIKAWKEYFSRGSWLAAGLISANSLPLDPIDPILVTDFFEMFLSMANNQILFAATCGLDCPSKDTLKKRLDYFAKLSDYIKPMAPPPAHKPRKDF